MFILIWNGEQDGKAFVGISELFGIPGVWSFGGERRVGGGGEVAEHQRKLSLRRNKTAI